MTFERLKSLCHGGRRAPERATARAIIGPVPLRPSDRKRAEAGTSLLGSRTSDLFLARRLYCGVLGGSQVWRPGSLFRSASLRFVIMGQVVSTGRYRKVDDEASTLRVDDPIAYASLCWNAGYEIVLWGESTPNRLLVVDPFGHRLELAPL